MAGGKNSRHATPTMRLRNQFRLPCVGSGGGWRRDKQGPPIMLKWALFFFVISLIAGLFGFTGISAATAGIARILFFVAIVVFLVFLVLALAAGNAIL
jgi:uncharacterized membrane protein YtjA (UPF0391 family)